MPAGPPESVKTCHASATRKAPSPTSDRHMPAHSSRKSRSRSGVSSPPRSTPPARSSASWLWSIGGGRALAAGRQEGPRRLGLHRAREVEALALLAAQVAQRRPLLGQLDALGDDLEAQRAA